jgi:hypothetical protein
MTVTLGDLKKTCNGNPKPSGLTTKLSLIPICDIETFGTIEDMTAATIDLVGKVTSANVPKTDKGHITVELSLHKNGLKGGVKGANGNGNISSGIYGKIEGFSDDTVGTLNVLRNIPLLAIVTMPDGESFQVGEEDLPAFLTFEYDTLTTDADDVAGFDIAIDSVAAYLHKFDKTLTIA